MSWYDARRAEQDAKYEKENNMDLHGLNDMTEYASPNRTAKDSQSSLQDNIDRCTGQLQRLEDLIATLNSRTSMVQKQPNDGLDCGGQARSEPGASEYANRVGMIWYRLEDLNEKLAVIVDRLDL